MKRILAGLMIFGLVAVGSLGFAQTTTTTTPTTTATTTTTTTSTPTATDIITEIVNTINPSEGVMYGVREHQVKDVTSFQIVGYQSTKYPLIAINGNFLYAPSNLIGGSITYPIGSFTSLTKITTTIPILSWLANMNVNVGYGLGWFTSGGTRTTDDGPVITGSIKF